jgi:hypothetical protein
MRMIEIDLDELDDDLAEFIIMISKPKEAAMREIIVRSIDPLQNVGLCFEFEPRPDDEFYLSLEVPPPDADVDIIICWKIAQLDALAASRILDRPYSSIEDIVVVYRNLISWLAFWEQRFPSKAWRERFSLQLADRRAGLAALKHKAKYQIRPDIVEELEAI